MVKPYMEFREYHARGTGLFFEIKKVLFSGKSKFQRIEVFETRDFGRMLVLDGAVMTTERDEFMYHEMLVHPVMCMARKITRILIIGGGDGGTLREVLKYKEVEFAKLVEIDSMVVEVSKRYLKSLARAFKDPRAQVTYEDGVKFVKENNEKFNVVIVDSPDPVGPAKVLFEKNFYENIALKTLTSDGTLVIQSESPFYMADFIKDLRKKLKDIFPFVLTYISPVPSYPAGIWSFTMASKIELRPICNRALPSGLKWFRKEMLQSLFSNLPEILKDD